MRRMMLYSRLGAPLGELAEADVFEAVLREEINGEHSLEITTTRVLEKGIRLLYEDGRSKWREFAVAGVDAEHASGNRAIGTYYCVWSMQEDLQGVTVSVMPGVQTSATAGAALTALLSTQSRWAKGTVTQTTSGGASMYDRSAWEALSTLVEVWGGEVDATISVDAIEGVTGRAVDLYSAQGDQTAKRRFDFSADLQSVKRVLADDPLFCRISPRGKGEQTDAGGYGRKITIESVNGGIDWLEYAPMVDAAKLPDGEGGYEYPTLIVENSDCETPADLKTWAQSVLADYCTPKVTYEIDVLQAGAEGVDVTGVSLGDAVQVVDRKFGGAGIRVEGRVRSMVTDLLNERDVSIVIGDAVESVSSKFASVDKTLAVMGNDLTTMSTAQYIDNLLSRINTEINATGGYTYITEGHGIRTYDTAVTDPLVGSEASQVVEIKGGSIRIANSKTAQGEWEWKTVFTSGHISADLVTAVNVTAGYIGAANGLSYWDLDNGQMRISGDFVLSRYIQSGIYDWNTDLSMGSLAVSSIELYNDMTGLSTTTTQYFTGLFIDSYSGSVENKLMLFAPVAGRACLGCDNGITLVSNTNSTLTDRVILRLTSSNHVTISNRVSGSVSTSLDVSSSDIMAYRKLTVHDNDILVGNSSGNYFKFSRSGTYGVETNRPVKIYSSFTVTGTKSRQVDTDNYSNRLLYAYETPTPLFGDVGSGVIGDDGFCYVEIDDIFSETVRADLAYQVFLQKCGEGDCWIEEKHSAYFVVQGTPNLAFDWELKVRQAGYEILRMEQPDLNENDTDGEGVESAYADDYGYINQLEVFAYEAA